MAKKTKTMVYLGKRDRHRMNQWYEANYEGIKENRLTQMAAAHQAKTELSLTEDVGISHIAAAAEATALPWPNGASRGRSQAARVLRENQIRAMAEQIEHLTEALGETFVESYRNVFQPVLGAGE